jgi:membrane protease YdiL (CAAX protease family)
MNVPEIQQKTFTKENKCVDHALILWGVFILAAILINGTIPFILGKDLHAWTASPTKDVLFNLVTYSGIYLVVPLLLTKKWETVRQPGFLFPLIVAIIAMTLRTFVRPVAALAVLAIAYLHWHFDLSELGFRSRGWRGDVIAILLMGLLGFMQTFFSPALLSFAPVTAFLGMLDRLFANPASTTENLFYFGFLTERLSSKFGRWWTPLLIGLMYGLHEMTNPEYWYERVFFPFIFIGVALFAMIYLWRRSVIVTWLGDGFGKFLRALF